MADEMTTKPTIETVLDRISAFEKRFESRFEQFERRTEQFEKLVVARFDKVDERFDKIDARFDIIDERFDKVDARFDIIDERFERYRQRNRSGRQPCSLHQGRNAEPARRLQGIARSVEGSTSNPTGLLDDR